MAEPKVSIIVPIHNSAHFLAECLASIERQTLADIEVVCVDDASTDESAAIVRAFAEADDRFKLVSLPENIGVSATRNRGLDEASGEFLLFMDSDDWYPADDTVEHLYRAAVDHGALIAGGEMSEFDANTGEIRTDYRDEPHLALYNFDRAEMIDYRDWQGEFGFTRFIYQRKLIEENDIRFPDLVRHEDPVFFVKAMIAAGRFYAIPEVVYRYRIRYKVAELTEKQLEDAIEAHVQLLVLADQNDLRKLRSYVIDSLRWYIAMHAPEVKAQVDAVRNSHSYRLGSVFMEPASRVKDLVEEIREQAAGLQS